MLLLLLLLLLLFLLLSLLSSLLCVLLVLTLFCLLSLLSLSLLLLLLMLSVALWLIFFGERSCRRAAEPPTMQGSAVSDPLAEFASGSSAVYVQRRSWGGDDGAAAWAGWLNLWSYEEVRQRQRLEQLGEGGVGQGDWSAGCGAVASGHGPSWREDEAGGAERNSWEAGWSAGYSTAPVGGGGWGYWPSNCGPGGYKSESGGSGSKVVPPAASPFGPAARSSSLGGGAGTPAPLPEAAPEGDVGEGDAEPMPCPGPAEGMPTRPINLPPRPPPATLHSTPPPQKVLPPREVDAPQPPAGPPPKRWAAAASSQPTKKPRVVMKTTSKAPQAKPPAKLSPQSAVAATFRRSPPRAPAEEKPAAEEPDGLPPKSQTTEEKTVIDHIKDACREKCKELEALLLQCDGLAETRRSLAESEESEAKCRPLERAETLRHPRGAARDGSGRRPADSALQEMRNNHSDFFFDDDTASCNGSGSPSRTGSVPPRPRSELPRTPARTGFTSCQRRLTVQQESRGEAKAEQAADALARGTTLLDSFKNKQQAKAKLWKQQRPGATQRGSTAPLPAKRVKQNVAFGKSSTGHRSTTWAPTSTRHGGANRERGSLLGSRTDPRDRQKTQLGQRGAQRPHSAMSTPTAASRHAYCCVLWAPADCAGDAVEKSIADALVLGQSLKRHKSLCSRVLLATSDLLKAEAAGMLDIFWDVRVIKHIKVPFAHVSKCRGRFSKVFTKLHAWGLDEFSRVALLDSDLLVRREIDEIMGLHDITALMRGAADCRHGVKRARHTLYGQNNQLRGGINAGVIVLAPSSRTLRSMEAAIVDRRHPAHPRESDAPEQDFITRFFDRKLHGLGRKYNFQLHQLALAGERAEPGSELESLMENPKNIAVLHYSSEMKPRDIVFTGAHSHKQWMTDFFAAHWTKEQQMSGLPGHRSKSLIKTAVQKWIDEWTLMWKASLELCFENAAWGENGRCPACSARMDLTHCFFTCERVRDLAADWHLSCREPSAGLVQLSQTPMGRWVVPSMRFVGGVFRVWSHIRRSHTSAM